MLQQCRRQLVHYEERRTSEKCSNSQIVPSHAFGFSIEIGDACQIGNRKAVTIINLKTYSSHLNLNSKDASTERNNDSHGADTLRTVNIEVIGVLIGAIREHLQYILYQGCVLVHRKSMARGQAKFSALYHQHFLDQSWEIYLVFAMQKNILQNYFLAYFVYEIDNRCFLQINVTFTRGRSPERVETNFSISLHRNILEFTFFSHQLETSSKQH